MGDMGLGGDERAPRRPGRNFTAVVVDRLMQTLAVSYVNCEGKTTIKGFLGEMQIELSFDKIKKVDFTPGDGGFADGRVLFRDGQSKAMRFKDLTRCYGESDLGKMMVRLKDLKAIEFGEPPPIEETPAPRN